MAFVMTPIASLNGGKDGASAGIVRRERTCSVTRRDVLRTAGAALLALAVSGPTSQAEAGGLLGNARMATTSDIHAVLGTPQATPEQATGTVEAAIFGLGCFWSAEEKYWKAPGVKSTSVGYAGGKTKDPTYRSVSLGNTGHAEVVSVLYDSSSTSYQRMLDIFWAAHDPTTLNRQGMDIGTEYRSMIMYYTDEQKKLAEESKARFDAILAKKGFGHIVTQIVRASKYYLAEEYHQQYLKKNPNGYRSRGGLGLYTPPTGEMMAAK